MEVGRKEPQTTLRRFPAELYLGAIQVEGILSFAWLRINRMAVVTHKHCLMWDTQWPEWLFDVVPKVEEEQEGERIGSMRLTPRRRRQREVTDVNTITEQELEKMLVQHHWVPPELPEVPSTRRCFRRKDRKRQVLAQIHELTTYGLRPGVKDSELELGPSELREIAKHLVMVEEDEEWRAQQEKSPAPINTVAETTGGCEGEHIEAIRQRLKEKYRHTTFRDRVWSNPPTRGPFGEAEIKLQPDGNPVRQRPFAMTGGASGSNDKTH